MRRSGLLSAVILSLAALSAPVLAATQCVNPGAPAPLEFCVQDDTTPEVYVDQPNGRQYQYYAGNAWGTSLHIAGQQFGSGYYFSNFTPVSNTLTGTGTAIDPYVLTTVVEVAGGDIRFTQELRYVNGDRTISKIFKLENVGASTFNDVRLLHGGDTYFGGDDNARSWYDPLNKMVYVTNVGFSNSGLMGFYANPATPSSYYQSGYYGSVTNNIYGGQLDDTADSNFMDAGYGLQWNRASLAAGEEWIIESFEVWTPPGPVQVLSPPSTYATPGTTMTRTFRVQNLNGAPATINFSVGGAPNGWTMTLPDGNSALVASMDIVDVPVVITVPPGLSPGAFEDITLTATSGGDSGVGISRLSVPAVNFSFSPISLTFGAVSVGNHADLVLTFSNQAASPNAQIGTLAAANALAAPFSIVGNTCSNTTVAASASCAVTVRYTPTTTNSASDSFSFPVLSPIINTYTISVTAPAAPSNYLVTASAGSGGSISPGSASVAQGNSTSFTVTAATGHQITGVGGTCGGSLAGNTYTTAAVTAACSVHASFAPLAYMVTVNAGAHGSVSPGSMTHVHGTTPGFTFTPDVGYQLDSVSGCGGSLAGNVYTAAAITGACTITGSFAASTVNPPAPSGPVFTPASPPLVNVDSTGLKTRLPADIAPTAVDGQGNALTVTLVGGVTDYSPGAHVLTWRAVDADGVESTVTQQLHVWPIVSLGPDISVGYVMGNSGSFRIALNGPAPVYPFEVSFTVSGYQTDHDLSSDPVSLVNGEVEKEVFLAVTATAAAGIPTQTVQVALEDADLNLGARSALTISLLVANAPPAVSVRGTQQGEPRPVFARDAAQPVTLRAQVSDPNGEDTHTLQWSAPAGASFTVVNGELVLDPSSLQAGIHAFTVVVTDNGSPAAASTLRFEVVIAASAPVLPDGSVGWADSGLPAHPDYSPPTRNVLPELEGDLDQRLIEAMPGVQLELGALAREQGVLQAGLTSTAAARLPGDSVRNAGGIYDFTAALPRVGSTLTLVVPQSAALGSHDVYRMFDANTRTWQAFVEGPNDFIRSAPAVNGVCPPPGSTAYAPGLNTGATCVQLTISDGGPNDRDGGANGKISQTGGVAALNEVSVTASGSGKSGGGGGLDALWLALCAALLMLRSRARQWLAASLLVLPLMASAGEGWYVGGQWGQARGDATQGHMNSELADLGYDVNVHFDDQSRAAWKLFGGYQFSRHFGVRAGYTELGEVESSLSGNILDVNALLVDVTRLHPHSASGVEAAATARYPFGARFAVTGELGLMRWDSKYRALNEAGQEIARLEDSGTDLLLGMGVEYSFSPRWTVGAQWTRYDIGGETVNLASVALRFGFSAE